jgi:adenylosuccinate synthase
LKEDHNMNTKWQGEFKVGPFDLIAADYGIQIFNPDYLCITCIDRLVNATCKVDELKDFPICDKYILPTDISVLTQTDSLNILVQLEDNLIKKIVLRNDLDAYQSLDLLKIIKDANPNLRSLDSFSTNNFTHKFINKLKEKLMGIEANHLIKISSFLELIETNLNVKIAILSTGPTHEDKVCVIDNFI